MLVVVVALVLSLGQALGNGDHNENMYVAAADLVAAGRLPYQDFAFVQMPYQPVAYGAIMRVLPMVDRLLLARLVNWLAWLAGAAVLYQIARTVGLDFRIALAFCLLYLANPSLKRVVAEASNYTFPVPLALGQAALLLRVPARGRAEARWLLFALGVLGGLAVGFKLYYAATVVPFMFVACFARTGRLSIVDGCVVAAGFGLALLPAVILAARYPFPFAFDNLSFHGLTTEIYRERGGPAPIKLIERLKAVRAEVIGGGSILLLMIGWGRWLAAPNGWRARDGLLPCILAAVASAGIGIIVAVFMSPFWPQYMALAMPYLLVAAAVAIAHVPPELTRTRSFLTWTAAAVALASSLNPRDVRHLLQPGPLAMRKQASAIAAAVRQTGVEGKLATLQPLHAIQSGLPYYAELASGPFVFAVADRLNPAKQRALVAVGPGRLEELFAADPPAAILARFYPGSAIFEDQSLLDYARRHGYRKAEVGLTYPVELYLRDP